MSRSSEKIMEEIGKLLEAIKREENSKASMITEFSGGYRNYILYECFKALTDELKAARDNELKAV